MVQTIAISGRVPAEIGWPALSQSDLSVPRGARIALFDVSGARNPARLRRPSTYIGAHRGELVLARRRSIFRFCAPPTAKRAGGQA